jgi:hypothetical protein
MHITSDWTSEPVLQYQVELDSLPIEIIPPTPDGNGNYRAEYDVTNVAVGTHQIRFGADNGWEVTWSDPFSFERPLPLSAPTGLKLEQL